MHLDSFTTSDTLALALAKTDAKFLNFARKFCFNWSPSGPVRSPHFFWLLSAGMNMEESSSSIAPNNPPPLASREPKLHSWWMLALVMAFWGLDLTKNRHIPVKGSEPSVTHSLGWDEAFCLLPVPIYVHMYIVQWMQMVLLVIHIHTNIHASWLKVTSKGPTYVHFPCTSSEQVKLMYFLTTV